MRSFDGRDYNEGLKGKEKGKEKERTIPNFGNVGNDFMNIYNNFSPEEKNTAKGLVLDGLNPYSLNSNHDFIAYKAKNQGKSQEELIFDFCMENRNKLSAANREIILKNHQNIKSYLNTGKSFNEIRSFNNPQYLNARIQSLNISDQQKSRLNQLSGANKTIISDLLENENNRNFGVVLLDTLIFIKEGNGDIFNGNIKLGEEGINALKSLYPDIDPNHITLKQLNSRLSEDLGEDGKGIVRSLIENALNERFLSNLDKSLRSSTKIEDSNKAIDNIIGNSNSLKFFIEYYNYKNPGKALTIDISKPLSTKDKESLEKAIQEEFYNNGFVSNLTEAEKKQLDEEINRNYLKRRRIRKRFNSFGKEFKMKEETDKRIELAGNNGIGKKLLDEFSSEPENLDINDPRVFDYARKKFCRDNSNFSLGRLPPPFFKKLYEETNNFSNFNGYGPGKEEVEKFNLYFGKDKGFNTLCSNLKSFFPGYLKDAQVKVSAFHSNMKERKDEATINTAVGSVIKGIVDIFRDLGEENNNDGKIHDFELDKSTPVELENNSEGLIINGTFKGNPIKIKYDLITGEIYMNSCICKKHDGNKLAISFGQNDPNLYVGKIKNFESQLGIYNKNDETDRIEKKGAPKKENIENKIEEKKEKIYETFEEGTNEIRNTIGEQLEINQKKNEISTDFLKTLGIIDSNLYSKTDKVIKFEEGSDAYKVLEIINNSEESAIQAFSEKIKILARFAGRNRGDNKSLDNPKEYKQFTETIASYFDEKPKEKDDPDYKDTVVYFLKKIKKLNDKSFTEYTGKIEIPKEYTNPFASIIYEKFTDGEMPNRKLDKKKIEDDNENFLNKLDYYKDLICKLYG